ncbi:hypothetical protein [Sphingomonas sp.]|jgi:hypothetical protein|uniref:hypothetical protein n=1 Tax=Sphingomonas sp. TaxID=28214 RepID=UPI002E37E1E7|nr:hypothetical protein [Sphingomonas sp.]HEX4695770.1 hypothetical protein [Sphingomonas sp.]
MRVVLGIASALVLVSLDACGTGKGNSSSAVGAGDLVPSCYADAGLDDSRPPATHALFVVIDQTTGLDDKLRDTVRKTVRSLIGKRGDVAIYTFSALDRDHYPTEVASGLVESPVDNAARPSLPVRRLKKLDDCLGQQLDFAQTQFAGKVDAATGDASAQFSHSAIERGLAQISEAVRKSSARDKIVLLVSDMLEHSDVTSFYKQHQLRLIDPAAELDLSRRAGTLGDFGGARVIVVGAGSIPADSAPDASRNTPALAALHSFWDSWFEASHAHLTDYGEPDLMAPIIS